jgi:hypothetical protein
LTSLIKLNLYLPGILISWKLKNNLHIISTKYSNSGTSKQSTLNSITCSHCHSNIVDLISWRSWHLHQTLLGIRIVLFICRVKLFNLEFLKDLLNNFLRLNHIIYVFILDLGLLSKFFAASNTISNLKQFFSNFSNRKCFTFFDLSK